MAVFGLGFVAILVGGALGVLFWLSHAATHAVNAVGTQITKAISAASSLAPAFQTRKVAEEFTSSAVTVKGLSRLEVARLKQEERFSRTESDSLAWGLIMLPPIVERAEVPVEYAYSVDLRGHWDFEQKDSRVIVRAPPLTAEMPAPEISELRFYQIGGHNWQDDKPVRERLQSTLSAALWRRAGEHIDLVRETARRQVAEFVESWLSERFSDGKAFQVKVIFADEPPAEKAEDRNSPRP